MPGTYTRLTAEAQWRRSFTDPLGQIWTPFAILRADAIDASISNQPGVSNFLPVGDTQALRVMPTVGLEYRYPFINVQPWGTTTIEPIAQVIIRPNETYAGKLPNEDAQSLVFDASNLFSVDKFSGYDRVEGGGRANVGVQATTQFDRGGSVNVLFGQSYQLFGLNSFAVADVTNTGVDSGLQNTRSDYVARVNYSPNRTYTFSVRSRLDEATLNVKRFEAEGRANFDRWSVSMMYGNYAPQPELGYLTRREGLLGSASVKVAANWVVTGRGPLGPRSQQDQPVHRRRGLCGRLLRAGGQLCHVLQLLRGHARRRCSVTRLCCRSACGRSPPRPRIGRSAGTQ